MRIREEAGYNKIFPLQVWYFLILLPLGPGVWHTKLTGGKGAVLLVPNMNLLSEVILEIDGDLVVWLKAY